MPSQRTSNLGFGMGRRIDTALGERARQARERAGFTSMEDFAREIGVSLQTVYRTENGVVPGPNVMPKLVKALDVSEAWLRYGVGEESEQLTESETLAAGVVDDYLRGPLGADVAPTVAAMLRGFDFASIAVTHPGVKDVHRLRELIEFNRAIGSKSSDGNKS